MFVFKTENYCSRIIFSKIILQIILNITKTGN
jgi:hypothetical protein